MTGEESARAVYFVGPGRVETRTIPLKPPSGTVRVHSRLCGVSHGTEGLFFRGEAPQATPGETLSALQGELSYPVKYGYMNVGVTDDGERVFAFYPHQDRFYLPPEELSPLPDRLAFEDAVLLPTVETAVGIVHDLGPHLGETILVTGLGMVGLLTAALLRRMSLTVFAVDPRPARRAAAAELGCVALEPDRQGGGHNEGARSIDNRNGGTELIEELRSRTGIDGFDAAVNTSGATEALQLCLDTVALDGTVVEASWYGERRVTLALGGNFHRGRVHLRSAQVSTLDPVLASRWSKERRFRYAMDVAHDLNPGQYITHRFGFDQVQEAFEIIEQGPDEVLQVVLDPER